MDTDRKGYFNQLFTAFLGIALLLKASVENKPDLSNRIIAYADIILDFLPHRN